MFKLIFLSLGPLCFLLSLFPFVFRLRYPRWAKISFSSILLIGALKFWWFLIFCEKMFQPDLPVWVICVLSIIYDFVILLGLVSIGILLVDLIRAICRGKNNAAQSNSRREFIKCGLAAVAGGIAVRGVYDAMRLPDVKRSTLEFDNLPEEFDGYKIVQLSDIHVSPAARANRTRGIVEIVNSLKPDLIVITGDFIDGRVRERREDFAPLGGLKAKDGVLGCTGNHEYYSNWGEWKGEFLRAGINMLENRSVNIARGKQAITVGGINDPVSGHSSVEEAFSNASESAFKILLAHRPIGLSHHASKGIHLQLSGHTHGGAVLGMDHFVAKANENHVRGIYREHGLTLYVNSGTGQWSGFPTRLGVMSEISLLTLTRKKA